MTAKTSTSGESALDARAALAALAEAAKLLEQIARRAADWQPQPCAEFVALTPREGGQ